jgi:hypothetical protein
MVSGRHARIVSTSGGASVIGESENEADAIAKEMFGARTPSNSKRGSQKVAQGTSSEK